MKKSNADIMSLVSTSNGGELTKSWMGNSCKDLEILHSQHVKKAQESKVKIYSPYMDLIDTSRSISIPT